MQQLAGLENRAVRAGGEALRLQRRQFEFAQRWGNVLRHRVEAVSCGDLREAANKSLAQRLPVLEREFETSTQAHTTATLRSAQLEERASLLADAATAAGQYGIETAARAVAAAKVQLEKFESASDEARAADAASHLAACSQDHKLAVSQVNDTLEFVRADVAMCLAADARLAGQEAAARVQAAGEALDSCRIELAKVAADQALVTYIGALVSLKRCVHKTAQPKSLPRFWGSTAFGVCNPDHVPFARKMLDGSSSGEMHPRVLAMWFEACTELDLALFDVDPATLIPPPSSSPPARDASFKVYKNLREMSQTEQHNLMCKYQDLFGGNPDEIYARLDSMSPQASAAA